jgi:hypothetical protein
MAKSKPTSVLIEGFPDDFEETILRQGPQRLWIRIASYPKDGKRIAEVFACGRRGAVLLGSAAAETSDSAEGAASKRAVDILSSLLAALSPLSVNTAPARLPVILDRTAAMTVKWAPGEDPKCATCGGSEFITDWSVIRGMPDDVRCIAPGCTGMVGHHPFRHPMQIKCPDCQPAERSKEKQ